MKKKLIYNQKSTGRQIVASTILFAFLVTSIVGRTPVFAQDFRLPAPGVMVHLSPPLDPPILKGIKVHPNNPFRFDFILDPGDKSLSPGGGDALKQEAIKLIGSCKFQMGK